MEEILASIRKIISESDGEEEEGGAVEAAADDPMDNIPMPDPEPEDDGVLDLVDEVSEDDDMSMEELMNSFDEPSLEPEPDPEPEPKPPPPQPPPPPPEPETDYYSDQETPPPPPPRRPYRPPPPPPPPPDDAGIMSDSARHMASMSFSRLTGEMPVGVRTVEQLLMELMRPILKEWLDENLPPLVESLVREEIDRTVRGSRDPYQEYYDDTYRRRDRYGRY